jgi:hypothetical protein
MMTKLDCNGFFRACTGSQNAFTLIWLSWDPSFIYSVNIIITMMICAPLVRYKRSYLILFYLCKIFVNESILEAIIGLDSLMRAQGLGLPLITPHHARESSLNYGDYPMAWSR